MDGAHGIRTFMQKQIKDIEGAQRRAARFVKNEYGTTPGTIAGFQCHAVQNRSK